MAKSITRNYIYNIIYQVLSLVVPLVLTPYLGRVLGADGIGEFSYASSIVAFFIIFASLGTGTYGQREISFHQDDRSKCSEIFWNVKTLGFITSFIALCVYIVFVYFRCQNKIICLIYGISILNVMVDISWFFQGLEEFGRIIGRNILIRITNILFIFIFINSKDDVNLYAFGICLFDFLASCSLWFFLPKFINKPNIKKIRPFTDFPIILSLFVPSIAISIYTVLDKAMIGVFTNTSFENGYYEQAVRISKMLVTLATSLAPVMVPRIGYHVEKKEFDIVKKYMYKSYKFVLFLAWPMFFGLYVIAPYFVVWFYGEGFEPVVPLLRISAGLLFAIGINNATGIQYLIPSKLQNLFTLSVIIGAITNFVLNLLLIPRYYAAGAAIASVIAEAVIALVQFYFVRKEISIFKVIICGWKYAISSILMFFALYFVSQFFVHNFINTFILIAIGAAIYLLILIIIRDSFFLEIINKIKTRIIVRKG